MRKIIALLGILLAIVIPHPAYNPLIPFAWYIATNVRKKDGLSNAAEECGLRGRSSPSVCIALFTVSAGNRLRLNATPAMAPERADSQGRSSWIVFDVEELPSFPSRRARRRDATNSLVQNQEAVPPVSRINVPVCPNHRPMIPCVRITDVRTEIGPGSLVDPREVVMSICTCILHLTSSIGVLVESSVSRWPKGELLRLTEESWLWLRRRRLPGREDAREVSLPSDVE